MAMAELTKTVASAPEAGAAPPEPGPQRPTRTKRSLGARVAPISSLFVWAGLILLFTLLVPETFPTTANLRIILSNEAISAIVALGLLLPLAAGRYDLSIGGVMSISVAVSGSLMANSGWSPAAAVAATLLLGAFIGAINGFVIVRLGVDSFIATLGMSSILGALTYRLLDGQDIVAGIPAGFKEIGQEKLFTIPLPVFYMAAIALVLYFILEHTPLGRYLYATGSNADATRLAGIPVDRYVFLSLIASASLASLAGVILTAKIGTAPVDAGMPYLIPAFAAALLGSTQIKMGRVNVLGTLVAIYLLATGVKGLELKFPNNPWIDDLFQGVALIVAVALSVWAAKRKTGSQRSDALRRKARRRSWRLPTRQTG
jgi:ribose transport system permease protein